MGHIRPLMLAAALLTSACGSGPGGTPAPAPLPNNEGNRSDTDPNSPTDQKDPNGLKQGMITNNVQLSLQESSEDAVKRTAAISCTYSAFSSRGSALDYKYYLSKPQRATCHYGYKKHTATQEIPNYQAPSSLVKTSPDFPADLQINPLTNVGGQNTAGISVNMPLLPIINTNACHTAELRMFSRGTFKNYLLTRNKSNPSFFDMNSTDYSEEISSHILDVLSGYFTDNTRRDPVEVIYLCDWNETPNLENDAISGLDEQIATRTGSPATWSIQISQGETLLKSLDATSSKDVYEILSKHFFDRDLSWTTKITARGKDGIILATNDQADLANDEQRNFWNEHCSTIDTKMTFESKDYLSVLAVSICDLSKALRTVGVTTPIADAPAPREHYVAPVHCKVSKIVAGYERLATSAASRQVCDFAVPALMPTLPQGARIGVLNSWTPASEILDVGSNRVFIDKIFGEKVVLDMDNVKKFNNLNRYSCRQAVVSFKTADGNSQSVVLDTLKGADTGDTLTFSRSTNMSASDEISAAAALKDLHKHLKNTANATTDMDIYMLCSWWALPGEKVTSL